MGSQVWGLPVGRAQQPDWPPSPYFWGLPCSPLFWAALRLLSRLWLEGSSDINLSAQKPLLDARLLVWGLYENRNPWL